MLMSHCLEPILKDLNPKRRSTLEIDCPEAFSFPSLRHNTPSWDN